DAINAFDRPCPFRAERATIPHRRSHHSPAQLYEASPAAGLLRRERSLPLPRPVVRGPALCPGRRARRRVAAHRLGGARLLPRASALAEIGGPRPPRARLGARAGR